MISDEEYELRDKVRNVLYEYGLCGSDPDNVIDTLASKGIVFSVKSEKKQLSNLVEHARVELELINEEPETVEGYLRIVQAFSDMGHSGGSASVGIPVLMLLLQFKNLLPLTDNPDEWFFHDMQCYGSSEVLWQNKRNSEAFSYDGGKTYYLLSEDVSSRWYRRAKRKFRKSEPFTLVDQ